MKSIKITLTSVFIVILLIWGVYTLRLGIVMSPDSYVYDSWSDILICHHFNIFAYQNSVALPTAFLYVGFVSLVALAKVVAGSFWPQLIVIINIFLGALVGVMLADLIYSFTKSVLSVWIILLLYVFNPEIMLWPRYVLSDVSYMFINFLIFYLIAKVFLGKGTTISKYWIFISFFSIVNFLYRATGLVMIPLVLFAWYLHNRKKTVPWKAFFAYFTLFVLVAVFLHAVIIKNILPLGPPGKSILKNWLIDLYQNGIIIHDRPYTYHPSPVTLLDYVRITMDKFIHYFYFSDKLFSFKHKLINHLFFVPLYSLFVVGIIGVAKERNNAVEKTLLALCIIVIIAYSVFHAMTIIDFDWRYRLPILPYMLVVSGLGINFLLQRAHKG
jgi:hypothetical protein